MTGDVRSRYGKGLAAALALHLLLAAVVGVFGYSFTRRPPQILEVTLTDGGGGAPEEAPEEVPPEEEVVVPPVVESVDDIVEKKKDAPKPRPVVKKSAKPAAPAAGTAPAKPGSGGEGTGEGEGIGNKSGEGMGAPATPPRLLKKTEPHYPSSARSRGVEGTAYVRMLVSERGAVESAELAGSAGDGELDASALKAVYSWRFSPAKNTAGSPVKCYITVPVKFSLRR